MTLRRSSGGPTSLPSITPVPIGCCCDPALGLPIGSELGLPIWPALGLPIGAGIGRANGAADFGIRQAPGANHENEVGIGPAGCKNIASPVLQRVLHVDDGLAIGRQEAGCEEVAIHRLHPHVAGGAEDGGNGVLFLAVFLREGQSGQQDECKKQG